jgi:hypothetical protein
MRGMVAHSGTRIPPGRESEDAESPRIQAIGRIAWLVWRLLCGVVAKLSFFLSDKEQGWIAEEFSLTYQEP